MIELIHKILIDNNGKIIPARTNKKYLEKTGLMNFINNSFDETYSIIEKIYCISKCITEKNKCECGKYTKFVNGNGYNRFCSKKCASNNIEILKKNSKSVSSSLKKTYELNHDAILNKRSLTIHKKFGVCVNTPFKIKSIQDKIQNTNLSRFGVKNVFEIKENRSDNTHTKISSIKKWNDKGFIVNYDNDKILSVYNACNIHQNFNINTINLYNRAARNRNGILCPICNPINSFSSLESEFENILKKLNIKYICKDRKQINPIELDFYIPDHNLAFELNGIYWHSEIFKDKFYHFNKNDRCIKAGIKLIQIWEDDFYAKPEIILSIVKNNLKLTDHRIYARNCEIKTISSSDYRNFLDINHLQGMINSSVRIGLFYNDILVSAMGFGKLRVSLGNAKINSDDFELQRFANKINYNVIGGASKLLNFFEKKYEPVKIISYAKKDYSLGDLYFKLGFNFISNTVPGYYWIKNGKRMHRFSFRKNLIKTDASDTRTEVEIMHENGFFRIFDSGNLKFEKNFFKNVSNIIKTC